MNTYLALFPRDIQVLIFLQLPYRDLFSSSKCPFVKKICDDKFNIMYRKYHYDNPKYWRQILNLNYFIYVPPVKYENKNDKNNNKLIANRISVLVIEDFLPKVFARRKILAVRYLSSFSLNASFNSLENEGDRVSELSKKLLDNLIIDDPELETEQSMFVRLLVNHSFPDVRCNFNSSVCDEIITNTSIDDMSIEEFIRYCDTNEFMASYKNLWLHPTNYYTPLGVKTYSFNVIAGDTNVSFSNGVSIRGYCRKYHEPSRVVMVPLRTIMHDNMIKYASRTFGEYFDVSKQYDQRD